MEIRELIEKNYRQIVLVTEPEQCKKVNEMVINEVRKYYSDYYPYQDHLGVSYDDRKSFFRRIITVDSKKHPCKKGEEHEIINENLGGVAVKIQIIKK